MFSTKIKSNKHSTIEADDIGIKKIETEIIEQLKIKPPYLIYLQKQFANNPQNIETIVQLKKYWYDSLKIMLPFYYYVGIEAKIKKDIQGLKTAGTFFYENLKTIPKPDIKKWFALNAKDLFEQALKIEPDNDSLKIFLGATILLGEIGASPMQGVAMMREVVERDSMFMFGQKMLGIAAMISGQLDKAQARFLFIQKHKPQDLENLLLLGEVFEKTHQNKKAIEQYDIVVSKIKNKELVTALKQKIKTLN